MNAIAFKIVNTIDDEVVMRGIVRDVYDNIYPQNETRIEEMPYETEIRHFKVAGYKLTYFEFDLSYNDAEKFRTSKYNF